PVPLKKEISWSFLLKLTCFVPCLPARAGTFPSPCGGRVRVTLSRFVVHWGSRSTRWKNPCFQVGLRGRRRIPLIKADMAWSDVTHHPRRNQERRHLGRLGYS